MTMTLEQSLNLFITLVLRTPILFEWLTQLVKPYQNEAQQDNLLQLLTDLSRIFTCCTRGFK